MQMQEDTEGVINFSLIKCVLKINCLQNVFKKNEITYFSAKKNTVRNILRYGSNKMRKFFLIIPWPIIQYLITRYFSLLKMQNKNLSYLLLHCSLIPYGQKEGFTLVPR